MRGNKFIIIAGLLTLNAMTIYVLFRIGTVILSLSFYDNIFQYCVVVIFFLAELFIVTNGLFYFINIITSLTQYDRGMRYFLPLKKWPKVIVFIPMKNEPVEIIEKTFIACHFIDYPQHQTVIVDSSDDASHRAVVKKLAQQYGLTYFMTPFPRHGAKAGALNEAMKIHSAEYFVLFDADYRPSRNALRMMVPLIHRDPKLAYVQTPQFYGNHEGAMISRVAQIQQSVFYEYISEAKSVHNAMFLCGTNMIIRKKALDMVGGWDESTITEDFSTSVKLMMLGWKNKYFNFIVAVGDGPLNLRQYFKQQYRWARGTFESYFTNFPGVWSWGGKMKFWQKVELSLSGFYFCVGLVWMILIIMPILYVFFRIPAYTSDPLLFTIAYLPYSILSFTFFAMTMSYRQVKISDLLKSQSLTILTLPVFIHALFDTILRRNAKFETVTKTGMNNEIPHDRLWFQYGLFIANILAVLYGLYTYPEAGNRPALASNIFWALFHSLFMLYFIISLYAEANKKNRT